MPGDRDDREIFIPGDMEEIVDWALGDISTGFLDYATAYGISSGLPENIQNYVSQLETLKEPDMISNYFLLPSLSKSLQELNEDNYNVYGGLGPVYTAYSDVVFTMLEMVDSLVGDERDKILSDLRNGLSLDELFNNPPESLAKIISQKGFYAGTKKGVGNVFSQILKDHNKELFSAAGGAAAGTFAGFLVNALFNGKISYDDLANLGVTMVKEVSIAALKQDAENPSNYLKLIFKNVGEHEVNAYNNASTFIITFIANVTITALSKKGDFDFKEDLLDAGVNAGISTVSNIATKALVTAICESIGVSAAGGPATIAIAVTSGILAYFGSQVYEGIKTWWKTNGDGIPKEYQHMTNKELIELLHKNGIDFGVPKYPGCDCSAYDIANGLAKYGASEELITIVEVGVGAKVPVDNLFLDDEGTLTPEAQAIIDFFNNPGYAMSNRNNSDEDWREWSDNPESIPNGYSDRYNEQLGELFEIFEENKSISKDKNVDKMLDYFKANLSSGGSVIDFINSLRNGES